MQRLRIAISPYRPLTRNTRLLPPRSLPVSTLKWFGFSVLYNVYNSKAIAELQNPLLVTSTQMCVAMLAALPSLQLTNLHLANPVFLFTAAIVSVGQWYGNYFGNLATQSMNFANVNIIKSCEPIMSLIIMYLFYRTIPSLQKIAWIPLIMLGIGMSINGSIELTYAGVMFCLLSNLGHICKAVLSNKVLVAQYQLTAEQLFGISMIGSFLISNPLQFYQTNWSAISPETYINLFLSSVSYYYNSVAAFDVIARVSPVSFSVLNIYKRVAIIAAYYLMNLQLPSLTVTLGIILSNISLYNYLV